MTIFGLIIYSCVRLTDLGGDMLSMTCRWDARDLYRSRQACEAIGVTLIGAPIFSDVADGRTVEKMKCVERHVE